MDLPAKMHKMHEMKMVDEEAESLVSKCQENGWFRYGGHDWQDDPWLEEYSHEFSRTDPIGDICEPFA